jgi:hypothetical protein
MSYETVPNVEKVCPAVKNCAKSIIKCTKVQEKLTKDEKVFKKLKFFKKVSKSVLIVAKFLV